MADMQERFAALQKRKAESATLNRKDLIADTNAQKTSARTAARLERKRKQAEMFEEKKEDDENGVDRERKKNWEYSIEENEKWEERVARKGRRGDFSITDYDDMARRKYKKDLDVFKPDLKSYNAQKAQEAGSSSSLVATSGAAGQQVQHSDLYRDANTLLYADHKPTDDAIDRVIGKINLDLDKRQKRSRERKDDDKGDITWINSKNEAFNKKLGRYYDKYTQETRDNFERGTAL